MEDQTVVVFGASGRPGSAQLRQLKKQGFGIRAVTRQPHLKNPSFDDVEIVTADYADPASLKRACAGADAVFFTPPAFTDVPRALENVHNLGRAAAEAGIKRLVYNTTSWHPDEPVGVPTMDRGLERVKAMESTGVPLTVVRPSLFMDNLLTQWVKPFLIEENEFSYPHNPDLEVSWICLDDVALFMIETLKREDFLGERIDVGGPQALRPGEVAGILSEVLKKPITFRYITPREFGERLYDLFKGVSGLDREAYVSMLEKHYVFKNEFNPFFVDPEPVLKRLPVTLTPMANWAQNQDWSLEESERIGSVSG